MISKNLLVNGCQNCNTTHNIDLRQVCQGERFFVYLSFLDQYRSKSYLNVMMSSHRYKGSCMNHTTLSILKTKIQSCTHTLLISNFRKSLLQVHECFKQMYGGNTFGVFTIHLDVPWDSTATHLIPSKNWLHPFRYFSPKHGRGFVALK